MTEKEKALLSGCVNGDKAAWDAFVLQHSALVYHTIKKTFSLYHVEARQELVEDLFQEFFLSILRDDFRKLRQFRGDKGCSLASWLRVVASRLTIDYLRSQKQHDVEATESLSAEQPTWHCLFKSGQSTRGDQGFGARYGYSQSVRGESPA